MNGSILTGTTGGNLGAGASGVVSAGFQLSCSYGTVALATGSFITSILPNGQPLNKFRIAMTAPSGNAVRDSMVLATSITVTPGDTVYLEMEEDISGITAESFLGQRLQLIASDGTKQYIETVADPDTSPASYLMLNFAFSGVLRTAKLTVPPRGDNAQLLL